MYSVNMQERTGTNMLKDTDLYVVAITVVLCTFVRILYTYDNILFHMLTAQKRQHKRNN